MQAICGKALKNHGYGKKIFFTAIIIFSVLIITFLRVYLFYYAIHPFFYFPGDDKVGVYLYTKEEYLNYEYGKEFKKYITSYDFTNKGEIIYFYYRDNYVNDNPVHGKMSDIFAIDIKLNPDDYIIVKETLITDEYYAASLPTDKFIIYSPIISSPKNFTTGFAVNDTECIVRLFLVTETENLTFSDSISFKLKNQSSLSFD